MNTVEWLSRRDRMVGASGGRRSWGLSDMKHKTIHTLFDYWNAIRAGRPAPLRSEIQPGEIRSILPNVFILEREKDESYRFRLAGTGLCSIYGMEFRNHNLLSMWQGECVASLRNTLDEVTRNAAVSVIEYTASTSAEREATFEMILMPLAQENGVITRVLGAAVPIDELPWIGDHLLSRQWIDRLQLLDPDRMPKREHVAEPARRLPLPRKPFSVAHISSLANRRPPLRSERSYLRLVKTAIAPGE